MATSDADLHDYNLLVPALRVRFDVAGARLKQFNLLSHQTLIFRERLVIIGQEQGYWMVVRVIC